jgi:hypothetical protein
VSGGVGIWWTGCVAFGVLGFGMGGCFWGRVLGEGVDVGVGRVEWVELVSCEILGL